MDEEMDAEIEIKKHIAHDRECEMAAMAVLKERKRMQPTQGSAAPHSVAGPIGRTSLDYKPRRTT